MALYNGRVQVRQQVDQSWANVDVLLRQRHDELPKLIAAVTAYTAYAAHTAHERGLLERVTGLRAQAAAGGSGAQRMAGEQALSAGVSQRLAVAERYPALRASELFMALQSRISALEDQIAHRREFYNAAVNLNNVRREEFPDRLFAAYARLVERPLFVADAGDRADVDVSARADR